jgi:hypothetical protein
MKRQLGGRGWKFIAGGLVAALSVLAFSSQALASSHHPTGEFEQFGECPLNRATITDCVYSVTSEGEVTLGNKTVPIENSVILQGGFEGTSPNIKFFGAENGETLSETPQPVPGGLLGLLNCKEQTNPLVKGICEAALENALTGVNAIVELAEPATSIGLNTENLIFEEGVALDLPVKIRLENALLGGSCYVGSNKHPIHFKLTTGTTSPPAPNEPISGELIEIEFNGNATLITIEARLVDNSFPVSQGANGCAGLLSFAVDPVIDGVLGTPNEEGENTAILEGELFDAASSAVIKSE